jgi:hypothetical protein
MRTSQLHFRRALAGFIVSLMVLGTPVNAADLQARTAQNYERYIALTQAQIDVELTQGNPYLWVERLPEPRRSEAETQLRNGEVVIERLETLDNGNQIPVPGAMIHHWIATIFVPRATLAQTLAFMQDYDHNAEYFRPDIVRSKIIKHEGDDYLVQQRFYKKKIITTVIETDQQVHYHVVDTARAWSRSRDTRVQEVENAGRSDERLDPAGRQRIRVEAECVLAVRREGWRHVYRMYGNFLEPRYTHRTGLGGRVAGIQPVERIADVYTDNIAN